MTARHFLDERAPRRRAYVNVGREDCWFYLVMSYLGA